MSSGSWLQFGNSANKFKSSYVRGFLDVSGDIQLSGGGNITLLGGDISCNGDIYINRIRDLAGNLIVSSGGSGTVIDDTTNLTINSLTEVKSTSRLTGNVGIGKASTGNALDVSGNTIIGGNITINGTTEITGANVSVGKVLDANYNLDISGNARASGDIYVKGTTVIASDASTSTETSGAILYIKDTRTDVSNNIIMDAPNAMFKSVVNGNLNRTAHLEIDTTNRQILPSVKDANGNNIDVSGSVVDGWKLGGPGANRFDKIYARDVMISTNTLLIEDDGGNKIGMSFDAATGAVNYNVTTAEGEQFLIKGVQTQKISSGGGTIDPSLLEFTGLSFGDTFDSGATFDFATAYTYNLATTAYTPDSPTSFSEVSVAQNLKEFLSPNNITSLLGSLETGDSVVIRVGLDNDRDADQFLAPIESSGSQSDRSNRVLIVKKKTETELEWSDWGDEAAINNNILGNYLNYIELKNVNMASGTYFVAKTNGNIEYNISDPDYLTVGDLTGVVNGDLFLYVARGSGKNWTKIPVSLPQSGSIQTQMLANQAVTTTKMGLVSVTNNILAADSVTTDKIQDGAITASKIGAGAISASSFGDGSISGVKITTGTITLDRLDANALNGKQNSLTAGDNITIVGSTISAVVDATIGAGTINSSTMFGPNVVDSNAIAGGSISVGKLSSFGDAAGAAVDYTKLATDAVIPRTIQSGAVETDKIQDGAVTDAKISVVNGSKLVTASVVAGKIAAGAVNITDILANGIVTGGKLHKDAVDDYLSAGSNVTFAKDTNTGIITISSSGGGGGGGGTALDSTTDVDVKDITVHGDISGNNAANFNILQMNNLASHIIPTTDEIFDLGSAAFKFRHLFLSNNSLWMGDEHKIDITDGEIKFRKRIKDKVPSGIAGGNIEEAKTFLAAIGRTRNVATDFTIDDWQQYAKIKGVPNDVGEIYLNDDIEESLTGNIKQW